MDEIRPIQTDEIDEVAGFLGRAFADNPPYRAIFASMSDAERHRTLVSLKRGFVRAAFDYQVAEALVRDGRIVAASLVCDPGQYPVGVRAKLRHVAGCVHAGPRAWRNLLAMDSFIAQRHIREPHFYLFVLGVDPEMQGRGFGKQLLRHLSARADAARLPCYLETDKETSVRLYESVGYEVIANERCAAVNGVSMWFMKRPAKSG